MKRLLTCLLLAVALVTNACALEVPTDTTIQNLNGSQQLIKTYTLPPGADPQQLIEEPFEQEGWCYTFTDIVKEENQVSDRKYHTETVTLETDTKDLVKILEQLDTTLDYDDGIYSGVLSLDHTAIRTEAAVKDGVTLNLSNVDWQVIGTDLVGDTLAPASYQAVATYSGKSYHKVATGYVTSADYVGEVTRSDVESVTYKVTYLGTESENSGLIASQGGISVAGLPGKVLPYALGVLGVGTVATLVVLLFRSRRALRQLQEEPEDELEHEEEST